MFTWFRRNLHPKEKGFTLIELVVVLAIIGILVAAAVPLYLGARKRAYKAEAENALQEQKTMLWAYYQQYATFTNGTNANIGFTPPNSSFWTYADPTVTATTATVVATGAAAPLTNADQVSVTLTSDGSSGTSSTF